MTYLPLLRRFFMTPITWNYEPNWLSHLETIIWHESLQDDTEVTIIWHEPLQDDTEVTIIWRESLRDDTEVTIWFGPASNVILRRLCNHCYPGQAISITFSECVFVAFVNQHAIRMCQNILSWPVRLYLMFPYYLTHVTIFVKTLLYIKCVFWFSLQVLSEKFLMLNRIERDMIKNVYWSSCKVHVILVRF